MDLTWVGPEKITEAHRALSLSPGTAIETRAAARRAALMRSDVDPARIEAAAQIVEACVPGTEDGFHLVRVMSEQSGLSGAT